MSETIPAWRPITDEERRDFDVPDGVMMQVHVVTGQLREIQMGRFAPLRGLPVDKTLPSGIMAG